MRRVSTALIASLSLAVCLGTVLSAKNISQRGGGWISAPLASARALASSLSRGIERLPLGRALMLAIGGQDPVPQDPVPPPPATVRTDKSDYFPGDTAFITGSGFAAGETVWLQVVHTDGTAEGGVGHDPWPVGADADGSFTSTWYVSPDDSLGSTFVLTAAGVTSGLTAQ